MAAVAPVLIGRVDGRRAARVVGKGAAAGARDRLLETVNLNSHTRGGGGEGEGCSQWKAPAQNAPLHSNHA